MPLEHVAECYQRKLATSDDVTDVILGPGCNYCHLNDITAAAPTKDTRELIESTNGLGEWISQARERILSIELERVESATAATDAVLQVGSWHGLDVMMRIMSAIGKEKFKILSGWNSRVSDSRAATLTKLIASTYPRDEDTTVEFNRRIKQAIKDGYCDEMRLLELAFLAPQWTTFVEDFLNWDGFAEGLYWFLAHMQNWDDSARQGAATAEGLENEVDDDNDDGENERFRKPRKLTAWERLVIERTPLNALERSEGAVDVDWFQRTWEQLGVKRWTSMASAAKFSANSAQAKKAQFLSDVLLGNTKKSQLVDGIKKRNLKDHVRLLGLFPLEKGPKRDNDVMYRYEVLQAYKKYARGLSSLTKPDALRALDIGFANLARPAGFRDPLRLEWALEAESVKDLASGPISITNDRITVTLSLDETAKPELTVYWGEKKLKSIFAGQQIWPRQAMALWGSRGCHTQDEVFKKFHDLSFLAES